MIISGGNNIYPREVEEVMLQHPAVQEVCVFGVPDPEWGEVVKAVVVVRPGYEVTEDELIRHCRNHLARYKEAPVHRFCRRTSQECLWKGAQARTSGPVLEKG